MQKCNENAANRYSYVGEVYNIGEKEIKNRILNGLNPEWKSLHENGYIHIHDLDAYGLTIFHMRDLRDIRFRVKLPRITIILNVFSPIWAMNSPAEWRLPTTITIP